MNHRLRSRRGQAIVIIALTGTLMMAGVGLAVDVVIGYLYSVATERAAAAAALSGVVFMPDQFNTFTAVPPGSRNDAWDRAIDEAKRNGFDAGDTANGVVVTPSRVPGHANQLQVTVGRQTPVFFMEVFGFRPYQVAKTAVAAYLPPISLGQPGSQIGTSLGDLGRTRFIFMRTEGWGNDRGMGDAYTPSPFNPPASQGASNDVHQISAVNGTEGSNPTLADRGGYNYQITVPTGGPGGVLQVYNAAYAPDGYGSAANFCDNDNVNAALRHCSIGGNNWYHEDDDMGGTSAANYPTMRYSLYRVNNVFIRGSDVLLSQLTVYPIDASNWSQSSNQYRIAGGPRLGQTLTQQYSGSAPSNMLIYHNWVDVATYTGPQDGGLVVLQQAPAFGVYDQVGSLIPGTYRLRVDTLDNMGRSFTNLSTLGKKGYALRAVNGDLGRSTCTTCHVTGWDDLCLFTPFDAGSGGQFTTALFQLTPDYAGLTVTIDLWDVGDIASTTGFVRINILDPTGALATSPSGINIYDLGQQRANLATRNYTIWASAPGNTIASFVALDTSRGVYADNQWIHLEIPVPATYNPPPGQYWWSMQYVTGAGTVTYDTVTVAVGLKGGPVHLVS
ncbi:MAG: hypothetical protein E6J01_15335 [Chloroflexi bacterium]|nr:MAG: hypothetical protein E6J01_15335 [Chloroflexota bacterium]